MSGPLLTFLKYIFLAVLYLFFLRVLRAVWTELREPKEVAVAPADMPLVAAGAGAPSAVAAGPPGAGALVVVEPEGLAGHRFPIGLETTVGRAPGCGVSLPDDSFVSQLHARVFLRDGDVLVEDLGSTNGTYVNHRKVATPAVLRTGDLLQVGRTVLERVA